MYFKHGQYWYVRRNKWIPLGKTEAEMFRRLAEVSIEHAQEDTVNGLIKLYKEEVLPGKAPSSIPTQTRYLNDWAAVIGHMRPTDVKPFHIAKVHRELGKKAPVSANRSLEVIRHVFNVGINAGYGYLLLNPVKAPRHKTKKKNRLIAMEEYIAVYLAASPAIQVAMELSRITGMRQGDILKLRWSEVSQDGLFNQASKNSRKIIFKMNRSLKATLDHAKTILKDSISHYVVPSKKGGRYTSAGFQSSWQRLIRSAGVDRFTFHDIRAMAASERESDKSAAELLGNTEAATRKYYRRGASIVEPNE